MTLPNERARAVINVYEFLVRLISPYNENGVKKIPKAVREEARRLAKHFPRRYELYAAAKACPEVFDPDVCLRHDEERSGKDI
jgi:hypothetical protein